jgi:hypothetical protein
MRTPILMALLVTAFALPAGAASHPVKSAAHGAATAGNSVVQGAGKAGQGIVGGTVPQPVEWAGARFASLR